MEETSYIQKQKETSQKKYQGSIHSSDGLLAKGLGGQWLVV
jgi:hypothetical protein